MQTVILAYRASFYELLRARLDELGVDLTVIHHPAMFGDMPVEVADLDWLVETDARVVRVGPVQLVRGSLTPEALSADLIVLEQAARLLTNYEMLVRRARRGPKVAWWGHGTSDDDETATKVGEWVKRRTLHASDWFFAYTQQVADRLVEVGYDAARITVVQNTTDLGALQRALASVRPMDVEAVRAEFGLLGENVCIFLGTLRPVRRFDLLLAAADHIRAAVPDFELVFVGTNDIDEEDPVTDFCATRSWAHAAGARFDKGLAAIAADAKLVLAPGWAGLVVVDSFALGVPLVASGSGPHPPEIAYLRDGVNGRLVQDDGDPRAYAAAAVELLTNEEARLNLAAGARRSAGEHSVEAMAERFADGLVAALDARD